MTGPWRPPALQSLGSVSLDSGDTPGGSILASRVRWRPAHRIIATEFADATAFERFNDPDDLEAFAAIADLTNPHALASMGNISLVPPSDRLYGSGTGLIMAAFTYPGMPSRFSTGEQGTFYASRTEHTAAAETMYHRTRVLQDAQSGPVTMSMTLLHVQLDAELVDIRNGNPHPRAIYHANDYHTSQQFAMLVRRLEGYGVVYDSVRDSGGECAAIFRPPALSHCRVVRVFDYCWDGTRLTVP